jgi:hypothetical protein
MENREPTSVDGWGWTQSEHRYWDDNQEERSRMNDLNEGEAD